MIHLDGTEICFAIDAKLQSFSKSFITKVWLSLTFSKFVDRLLFGNKALPVPLSNGGAKFLKFSVTSGMKSSMKLLF
jgi:hypothetical protein